MICSKGAVCLFSLPSHYHRGVTFETPTVSTSNSTTFLLNAPLVLAKHPCSLRRFSCIYICVCIRAPTISFWPTNKKCWFIFLAAFKKDSNPISHVQDCVADFINAHRVLVGEDRKFWIEQVLDAYVFTIAYMSVG